ncbi:hypothetical protein [Cohnella lupini]|uniref:AhpC/TSA family protein n=1 Tax=Cohnella lupini TaxID=1294267 RepID=A0A3D9HUJ0_9BACL|nr:hypothetical protein [Cohnella lupini]RED53183.1 hypothetical protein DFP95_12646 [Cohnella lupini]
MNPLPLEEQLANEKNHFMANTPAEAHVILERSLRELQDSGNYNGISIGAKAKDFTASDALGNKVTLYDELSNLAEYNSTNRWILPVPATFMIDESAIVRSAYVNPNFMQRMEPADILYELQKL